MRPLSDPTLITLPDGGRCGMIIEKDLNASGLAAMVNKYLNDKPSGGPAAACKLILPEILPQSLLADMITKG